MMSFEEFKNQIVKETKEMLYMVPEDEVDKYLEWQLDGLEEVYNDRKNSKQGLGINGIVYDLYMCHE